MTAKIYYDCRRPTYRCSGKTIAILGYGSQGHARPQNLRDSGLPGDHRPARRQCELTNIAIQPRLPAG